MIVTTDNESYNKSKGSSIPMISRAGKSTISMYLAFSRGKHKG
jgi:hypothetical protein